MQFFTSRLFFAFMFLLLSGAIQANEYVLQRVNPGIYYHQGVHEEANRDNMGAIANVGFIIGESCVAVIDSGGSYLEGELLHKAIRQQTDLPVCYVINTHIHPDHVLGNAAFENERTVFVGHEKSPQAMESRKSHYEKQFPALLGEAYHGVEFIEANKLVSSGHPLELNLGKRIIRLTAHTTAHTDHDLTVFDLNTQTLWTGDLLFVKRIPALDGSINGWIKAIQTLIEIDAQVIIPGHGSAFKAAESTAWQDLLHYLSTIRQQIRALIDDMGTIEEAIAKVGVQEADKWKLFEEYHRRNVTAAFVELEWE